MDYVTKDTALTATADAIRSKVGTSDPITWLEELGFSEAIAAIEASGAKVAYGKYTPAEAVNRVTFTHGLSVLPKLFIFTRSFGYFTPANREIYQVLYTDGSVFGNLFYKGHRLIYSVGSSIYVEGDSNINSVYIADETDVTLDNNNNTSTRYVATEYTWIAIGW